MSSRASCPEQHRGLSERGPAKRSGQRMLLIAAETTAIAEIALVGVLV
jgi:hypothetical protein